MPFCIQDMYCTQYILLCKPTSTSSKLPDYKGLSDPFDAADPFNLAYQQCVLDVDLQLDMRKPPEDTIIYRRQDQHSLALE
ncbi:hypothetical protein QVD99_000815 [Batrachochytrium dendrobatidis]|nr:hypothetical protein O5D80_003666 [Batrachochytrium dendrobatidis]KAK5673367.1 hypothetical protein QVD99_000815 [Batrachochytrium dendrobatidis]